jgi:hypothetical protein
MQQRPAINSSRPAGKAAGACVAWASMTVKNSSASFLLSPEEESLAFNPTVLIASQIGSVLYQLGLGLGISLPSCCPTRTASFHLEWLPLPPACACEWAPDFRAPAVPRHPARARARQRLSSRHRKGPKSDMLPSSSAVAPAAAAAPPPLAPPPPAVCAAAVGRLLATPEPPSLSPAPGSSPKAPPAPAALPPPAARSSPKPKMDRLVAPGSSASVPSPPPPEGLPLLPPPLPRGLHFSLRRPATAGE